MMRTLRGIGVRSRPSTRARGLLGAARDSSETLLLIPCRSVHTFGMPYGVDIALVDEAGYVLESKRGIRPSQIAANRRAAFVIERFERPSEPWPDPGHRLRLDIGWEEGPLP